jgi:enoyl-CoA hydratase/carnithine racemase
VINAVIDKGVREIRMNWPEVRNAMGPDEATELAAALEAAINHTETRVIVLSGEGKAFSAGGNLPAIAELAKNGRDFVQNVLYSVFQNLYRTIKESPVPVFALVEGPAVGLGCDLALACDARVVNEKASFRYGWSNVGLISALGGLLEMRKLIGGSELWSFISGDALSGLRAGELGVAIYSEDARSMVLGMASKIAEIDREVLLATKQLSLIDDIDDYLSRAALFQAGLITKPGFVDSAMKMLERAQSK